MQGKNVVNTVLAVVVIVFVAALFYFTNSYFLYPALLLLPVLALYSDAVNGRYFATAALLVCCSFMAFTADLGGMLIIFMLAIVSASSLVSLKRSTSFFDGMGYTMAASVVAVIAGIFAVYLANDRQDLMALAAQSMADDIGKLPQGYYEDNLVAYLMLIMSPENLNINAIGDALSSISGMARSEQAQMLYPGIKELLSLRLPGTIMSGSMLYGGIVWYMANLAIARAVRKGRLTEGVREFKAPREFSSWRLPRWMIGTIAVLLIAVLLIELSGSERLLSAAIAIQAVAMAAITVQGLALVWWYFKRWNLPEWGSWILMAIAVLLSGILVVWIGFIDVLFNIRAFTENKKRVQSAMDQMREKIEEEMRRQGHGDDDAEDGHGKGPHDDDNDKKQE